MRTTRQVLEALFEAFNRHDVDTLVELYAEDAVNHQMPTTPLRGRGAIRRGFEEGFGAIPDMRCRLLNVVSDGERGAVEWEASGTYHAPAKAPRPYRINGCGFFLIQDGVIVEHRGYWDSATMARQAGVSR